MKKNSKSLSCRSLAWKATCLVALFQLFCIELADSARAQTGRPPTARSVTVENQGFRLHQLLVPLFAKEKQLLAYHQPSHPEVIAVRAQIKAIRSRIAGQLKYLVWTPPEPMMQQPAHQAPPVLAIISEENADVTQVSVQETPGRSEAPAKSPAIDPAEDIPTMISTPTEPAMPVDNQSDAMVVEVSVSESEPVDADFLPDRLPHADTESVETSTSPLISADSDSAVDSAPVVKTSGRPRTLEMPRPFPLESGPFKEIETRNDWTAPQPLAAGDTAGRADREIVLAAARQPEDGRTDTTPLKKPETSDHGEAKDDWSSSISLSILHLATVAIIAVSLVMVLSFGIRSIRVSSDRVHFETLKTIQASLQNRAPLPAPSSWLGNHARNGYSSPAASTPVPAEPILSEDPMEEGGLAETILADNLKLRD